MQLLLKPEHRDALRTTVAALVFVTTAVGVGALLLDALGPNQPVSVCVIVGLVSGWIGMMVAISVWLWGR